MAPDELNTLQTEVLDHLWNGRHRMALTSAEKLYKERPEDSEAVVCYAWALLENGDPIKAMDYANLAVELKGTSFMAKLYRGFILMRMSIFEGALSDIDQTLDKQKEMLAFTYLNKARSLAGLKKFDEAAKSFELAILIDNGKNPGWKNSKHFYKKAKELFSPKYKVIPAEVDKLLAGGFEALKMKEYWFALFTARKINENSKLKKENSEVDILELESLYQLFQYKPALKKAEEIKNNFSQDERFQNIYNALLKSTHDEETAAGTESEIIKAGALPELPETDNDEKENFRTDSMTYPNEYADVFSAKIFDVSLDNKNKERNYYNILDFNSVTHVGVEVILIICISETRLRTFSATPFGTLTILK